MPYYEYECEDCGVFGCRAPMDAFANPADCPTCGKILAESFEFRAVCFDRVLQFAKGS